MKPTVSLQAIHNLNPALIVPHGDRYIVEKIHVDRFYSVGEKRILVEGTPEEVEQRDGYYLARIVAGGDGYRMESDVHVKMPYEPDEIVMVEKFSGREIKGLGGQVFTIINQVDILAKLPELEAALMFKEAGMESIFG
jgi:co-chaperonin GroES (HSP10)